MNPFLQRCLDLARLPGAAVEPNPRVGAVVVHEGRIIGEGYHTRYGNAHAEVEAVRSVANRELLASATLYVSLEPCNHQGKTPPCTQLILDHAIPKVVIGSLDPNPQMAGRSVDFLRSRGVEVTVNTEIAPFETLNRHFHLNQKAGRAWATLKWAESRDGFIAGRDADGKALRTPISDPAVSRYVHALRHEHQAILVGRNTVLTDDPSLTTRKFPGRNPIRIFIDPELEVPQSTAIFRETERVIVLNREREAEAGHVHFFQPQQPDAWNNPEFLLRELYQRAGIGSILVEGGAQVLQWFLDHACGDAIIRNIGANKLQQGVRAPQMPEGLQRKGTEMVEQDVVEWLEW